MSVSSDFVLRHHVATSSALTSLLVWWKGFRSLCYPLHISKRPLPTKAGSLLACLAVIWIVRRQVSMKSDLVSRRQYVAKSCDLTMLIVCGELPYSVHVDHDQCGEY